MGHSNFVPKPLVRLRGKALIDHVLDRIADSGIARAVVNVHYKADLIEAHLAGRTRPEIEISDERAQLMETGGGVKQALARLQSDAFLIHNSDSVWIEGAGSNLERLFGAWDDVRMDCLMLLAHRSISLGYRGRGDFDLEPDGRIRRPREREAVPFAFAGVSIAHPRLFENSPDGPFSLNLLWSRAISAGRAYGVRMEGVWMHVGSPEALSEAERCLSELSR
jgi:MurNAc alpha-1-phosphate uridylyltransferase